MKSIQISTDGSVDELRAMSEIEVTLTADQWELILEELRSSLWGGKPWYLSEENYKRLREANALIREAMYG